MPRKLKGIKLQKYILLTLLSTAILLSGIGCAYRYNYTTGKPESNVKITKWQHHLAWGLYNPNSTVNLELMSPTGIARFGSYESFTNWLCTFATFGFYAPETVYVIPPTQEKGL